MDAYVRIRKLKPDVIFSKGGFVSVPVVIGGWLNRVPVLLHESDMTPGLANKIALRFASKIFVTFEEAAKHLPKEKVIYTGSPVREEVLKEIVKRFSVLGFSRKSQLLRLWEAAWARKN